MMVITSAHNDQVKKIRELQKHGEYFWWEGTRFFEEVVKESSSLETLVVTPDIFRASARRIATLSTEHVIVVSDNVFERLSFTESPQGIGGLIKKPKRIPGDILREAPPTFYLAGLQDPGNVGSVVRIADAFGFAGVVYERSGVSPYNEKAVRASAGSILRVPCSEGDITALQKCSAAGKPVLLLSPREKGAVSILDIPVTERKRAVYVMGQEGSGITFTISGARIVYIPMTGDIDSLNVAAASAIVAFCARGE